MTTWIGTNQVGWDANEIAFHSIQGCTGLVLRTDHWLAGWHLGGASQPNYMGSNQSKIAFRGAAFLAYIQAIAPNPWPAAGLMAGTIKLWNIHNNHTNWQTELQDFANIIGYHGRARSYDLRSKIGAHDSCDVVVTRTANSAEIRYKRTNKMTHTPQTVAQMHASPVETLFGTPAVPPGTQAIAGPETHTATVVHTNSNKGRMHVASWFGQKGHTV